ncbi:MAG TPA: class E sortase [Trebonia sp.]|nr:class E sortase [Trebonia sp.]
MTGEACLTLGVVTALFLAYMAWGTGSRAAVAQDQFAAQLNQAWQAAPAGSASPGLPPVAETITVASGEPFAFLRIPAFGAQWRFTIIEGTQLAQLNVSPGHVPGTQLPGQAGNFAVAGHRVTAGNPFWGLPSLRPGDLVYVDTRYDTYAYRVTAQPSWVSPDDLAVLDPVPGHPGARPVQRRLTLITCDPAWTGTHRVIVTGELVSVTGRAGDPAAPVVQAQAPGASAGKPGF